MSGNERTGELTPRQQRLVLALAAGETHEAAAAAAGVSTATLRRWLHRPEFAAALREARRELAEQGLARLQQLVGKAVSTLERNLTSGRHPSEVRSALGVIDRTLRLQELENLEQRLAALEARMAGHSPSQTGGANGTPARAT